MTIIPNRRWPSVLSFPCRHRVGHSVCAEATGNMADTDSQQCEPVFVTARALLSLHVLPDTIDMCWAAENTSGRGSIRGAQRIRGLWRIYPCRQEARNKLLLEGMHLWRVQVSLLPIKPVHLTRPKQGETSYKTVGGKFPTWSGDHVIKTALKKQGCEMWSMVRKELAHDKNGKMTNWEMGRRFISTQSMIWKGNGEKIYSVYKEQIEITI